MSKVLLAFGSRGERASRIVLKPKLASELANKLAYVLMGADYRDDPNKFKVTRQAPYVSITDSSHFVSVERMEQVK